MNFEHLRYFLVLARLEHYGQAAEELCISQPGLSHAIAALEADLGVPLFHKKGRNISLTQYGRLLQKDAEKIIALVDRCNDTFTDIREGGGIIHIASIIGIASKTLPGLVKTYQQEHSSKGDFRFYTDSTQLIVQGVRDGRYDIGFCSRSDWKKDIEAVPFLKQQMMVIVKDGHPLSGKKSVSLQETLAYPQIIFNHTSALRPVLDDFFAQIHDFPTVSYEIEQDAVIAEMVACDFGIAVMPNFASINRPGLVGIPITEPAWENAFYIIRRKEDYHSPFETDFYDYCIQACPANLP